MTCDDIKTAFERDLTPSEEQAISEHYKVCSKCRAVAVDAVRRATPAQISAAILHNLNKRPDPELKRKIKKSDLTSKQQEMLEEAASILLVCVGALICSNQSDAMVFFTETMYAAQLFDEWDSVQFERLLKACWEKLHEHNTRTDKGL